MTQRLASLVAQLVPGEKAVRLLPAGEFRSADGSGRPVDAPAWRLDAKAAAALIARFNSRSDARVIDYEHATLTAADKGGFAPAAGWFSRLEWRDGEGLYATDVAWTAPAAAMVASQEYRYLSPVFSYAQDGTVLNLLHAGLTNNPGLDGLTDLAALSASPFLFDFSPTDQEPPMKDLLIALGLAETATEAEAVAAVAALKADAESRIAALAAAPPDPAKFVPVTTMQEMQGQIATLTARLNGDEASRVIDAALTAGHLLPAQRGWAEELAKTNLVALKTYIAATPANPALAGLQTQGKELGGKPGALTDGQLAVCTAMNIKPDDYLATLQATA